jgi:acetyltransferase-like isoleucine patch superfamily enzyme
MIKRIIIFMFRALRRLWEAVQASLDHPIAQAKFYLNGAELKSPAHVNGRIIVNVTRKGRMKIGRGVRINSGERFNIIGRPQKTVFWVSGELEIGDHVGLSATAIICKHKIVIGSGTKIGGNTVIYDTDFHSLNWEVRRDSIRDSAEARSKPVSIGSDVFIGAHSTILKGVHIGDRSIIGAGSVISHDIPSDEIWAGNPAIFIRSLSDRSGKVGNKIDE